MLQSFLNRLKYRRLEVDILTAFTFLFFVTSILVVSFTYLKSYSVISDTAEDIMAQVSDKISHRTNELLDAKEANVVISGSVVEGPEDLSINNSRLVEYLYSIVKTIDYSDEVYYGTDKGEVFGIVKWGSVGHVTLNLPRPVPENTIYALHTSVGNPGDRSETWIFKDENFNTLDSMTFASTYDVRTRPWYIRAVKEGHMSWTEPYVFSDVGVLGLTVSRPLTDKSGKVYAVVGSDIYLNTLSKFLVNEKVSQNSVSMVITDKGLILASSLPLEVKPNQLPSVFQLNDKLFSSAYQQFLKNGVSSFLYRYEGKDYLAVFTPFKHIPDQPWVIGIVAPASDFLGGVIQTYHQLILIFIGIFAFSVIFICWLSKRIARPIVEISHEIDKIKQFDLTSDIKIDSHIKEIIMIVKSVSEMKEVIKEFSYFVPKQLVQKLITEGGSFKLGGVRKDLTIFFSDIYGFTTIAEKMPPEELMLHLSEYLAELSRIVMDNMGTIDKYSGDNIMAFWGTPGPDPDQVIHACTGALLCQRKLIDLNRKWESEHKPVFLTRIGIHRGEVIVGNIGTEERMNYTVIGDVVNLASRLEKLNKDYHTKILISEDIHSKIATYFLTRPIDIVAVRGKTVGTKIYELVAQLAGEGSLLPTADQLKLCKDFKVAFDLFQNNSKNALPLFEELSKAYPSDVPTQIYIQRCRGV